MATVHGRARFCTAANNPWCNLCPFLRHDVQLTSPLFTTYKWRNHERGGLHWLSWPNLHAWIVTYLSIVSWTRSVCFSYNAILFSHHSEVKDPELLELISRLTSLLLQIEVSGIVMLFFFFFFFIKLNRSAKWEEAVDSNFSSSWDMWSCEYWCRLGNIWVLKMRIVPANTKPLFCRMTYSHTQNHPVRWAGSTNTCTPSAI